MLTDQWPCKQLVKRPSLCSSPSSSSVPVSSTLLQLLSLDLCLKGSISTTLSTFWGNISKGAKALESSPPGLESHFCQFTYCVALPKLHNLSEPQFSSLWNGDNSTSNSRGLLDHIYRVSNTVWHIIDTHMAAMLLLLSFLYYYYCCG